MARNIILSVVMLGTIVSKCAYRVGWSQSWELARVWFNWAKAKAKEAQGQRGRR